MFPFHALAVIGHGTDTKNFSVSKAAEEYISAKFIKKCSQASGSEKNVASYLILNLNYFDILVSSHPHI